MMKLPAIAAVLSGLFVVAAHAQNSVTLYGLIDAGITYTNNQNGHSNWQETSGSMDPSRWGLRGVEDLGGGLKAIFTLENGFAINNGALEQSGVEFDRLAFVGLTTDQFGGLTFGRQYDSMVEYVGPLSLTGGDLSGTQFAHPFDNDNLNNTFRINNSVKYQSPNIAGFRFGGMYGFSNQAGSFTNNRAYSFGASFNFACLNVGAAYLQLNRAGSLSNTGGAVTGDTTFLAGRQQTWGAAANCSLGPITAGLVYARSNLSSDPGISAGQSGVTGGVNLGSGSSHIQNIEANTHYVFSPALSFAGSYTYSYGSVEGVHAHWNQVNLQTIYALSKRTDVYLQGVYQHVNEGSGLAAYINGLSAASSNNTQVAVTAGLRHRF